MSPVFLFRMDRCIQGSTYRKAHCLLCSWPKDQTGIDALAGGWHLDRGEGSLRQTSSHTCKSGRASLAVVFTRLSRSLHTAQVQVRPINWLTGSYCLLVIPFREASTNPPEHLLSSSSPTTPQPSFLLFSILRLTTTPARHHSLLFLVLNCGSGTASASLRQIKATVSQFLEPSFALWLLVTRVNGQQSSTQNTWASHCSQTSHVTS